MRETVRERERVTESEWMRERERVNEREREREREWERESWLVQLCAMPGCLAYYNNVNTVASA